MNKKHLLLLLVPILILASCTKEETQTKTTTVSKPYVPPTLNFWGTWKKINTNNNETYYYDLNKSTGYCYELREEASGLRRFEISTVTGDEKLVRFNWDGFRVYTISGDTMTVYDASQPGAIEELLVRIPADSVNANTWITPMSITRSVSSRSNIYNINTSASFTFGGDFIFDNLRGPDGTYRFYQLNSLTGVYTDSANAPVNTWYSLYYKSSTNKLYHTRYSGTYNLQQRTGINGASSNLSSNSLNSIRAISANPSSGTVYAYRGGTLYSGTEGGNFSSLATFSGSYPDKHVYHKNDQFLGVWSNSLILFEAAPAFKVIKQYRLPENTNGLNGSIYSVASNGSDVWILTYNNNTNSYYYTKVTLP
jgi:hypothetical protein